MSLVSTGQYEQAFQKLNGKWTSLPGGSQQWKNNVNEIFLKYKVSELNGSTIIATPQGMLDLK